MRDDAEAGLEVHQLEDAKEHQDDVDAAERHVRLQVIHQLFHLQEDGPELHHLIRHPEIGVEGARLDVLVDVVVNCRGELRGEVPSEREPHDDGDDVNRDGRHVDVVPHRRKVRHVRSLLAARVEHVQHLLVHAPHGAEDEQNLHGESHKIICRLVQLNLDGVHGVRHLDLAAVGELEKHHDVAKISQLGVVHHQLRSHLIRLDVVDHQTVVHHVDPSLRVVRREVDVEEIRKPGFEPRDGLVPEPVRNVAPVEELLAKWIMVPVRRRARVIVVRGVDARVRVFVSRAIVHPGDGLVVVVIGVVQRRAELEHGVDPEGRDVAPAAARPIDSLEPIRRALDEILAFDVHQHSRHDAVVESHEALAIGNRRHRVVEVVQLERVVHHLHLARLVHQHVLLRLPLARHHRILLHGDVLFHARERVGRVRGVNRFRLLLDGARQLLNLPQAGLRERVGSLLNLKRLLRRRERLLLLRQNFIQRRAEGICPALEIVETGPNDRLERRVRVMLLRLLVRDSLRSSNRVNLRVQVRLSRRQVLHRGEDIVEVRLGL